MARGNEGRENRFRVSGFSVIWQCQCQEERVMGYGSWECVTEGFQVFFEGRQLLLQVVHHGQELFDARLGLEAFQGVELADQVGAARSEFRQGRLLDFDGVAQFLEAHLLPSPGLFTLTLLSLEGKGVKKKAPSLEGEGETFEKLPIFVILHDTPEFRVKRQIQEKSRRLP